MADKITNSRTLKIELLFVDGDTRTLTLNNPRSDLTATDILRLQQTILDGNLLIGDKYGGDFKQILKATRVTKTTTNLDIS